MGSFRAIYEMLFFPSVKANFNGEEQFRRLFQQLCMNMLLQSRSIGVKGTGSARNVPRLRTEESELDFQVHRFVQNFHLKDQWWGWCRPDGLER